MGAALTSKQETNRKAVSYICAEFDANYWLEKNRHRGFPLHFHQAIADAGWPGVCTPEEWRSGAGHHGAGHKRVRCRHERRVCCEHEHFWYQSGGYRYEPKPGCVLQPVSIWRCWSKTQSGLLATFRTSEFAMRLNTSQGRINICALFYENCAVGT